MKKLKNLVVLIGVAGILGAAGVAYAATYQTPAEIAAGLTGKTVESLYQERAAGKTFGTIADEAGKLDAFKAKILEQKKAVLDQRVKDGTMTQAQADEIYDAIKNNQSVCDGTGKGAIGRKSGSCFGQGCGLGSGTGPGRGIN